MKLDIKNIKKPTKINIPLFFSAYLWSMFTIISFVALVFGFLVFYENAYGLADDQFQPLISIKKVNTKSLDRALEFIEEEDNITIPTSQRNPFIK